MTQRDLYEVLGVSRDAPDDEIKKAYRKKAMQLHPDRAHASNNKKSKEQLQNEFAELQQAYDILSDPKKRPLYDAGQLDPSGEPTWKDTGFSDFEFGDLGDIFSEMFGGGRRNQSSSSRARQGADLRYKLYLNLEDIIFGCTTSINVSKLGACPRCLGSGSRDQKPPTTCSTCRGQGQVYFQQGPFKVQQNCHKCSGQGSYIASPCFQCQGTGRAKETRKLSVKIPAGVSDGDQIRLSGEGEAGMQGGPSGDLYVQVYVNPHPLFTRKGNNLHAEIPINYITAALGGEVEVPTLDGKVSLHIPKGTDNGKVLKLKGKGIRKGQSGYIGDLQLTVTIEIPKNLNQEQTELLKSFEATLNQSNVTHYPNIKKWMTAIKEFFTQKIKSAL